MAILGTGNGNGQQDIARPRSAHV